MGLATVTTQIGSSQESLGEMEFLVDTGAFYSFLPAGLGAAMGISFPVTSKVVLADSRTIEVQIGVAYLGIGDREGGVIVAAMDVPMPLMGVSVLEVLGLKVDPVTETIEASRPFGPEALAGGLIR